MSQAQKYLLLSLLEDEPIINNKETNGKAVALKQKAWDKIEGQFNAMNLGPRRTKTQLQKAWERLKGKQVAIYTVIPFLRIHIMQSSNL